MSVSRDPGAAPEDGTKLVSGSGADMRVPAFLGRVLDEAGEPVGTCFQVSPMVLATACHVVWAAGASVVGDVVWVDGLPSAGEPAVRADLVAVDKLHDLAVLRRRAPLPASIKRLDPTDLEPVGAGVLVTGHSVVPDLSGVRERFLDALGTWAGGMMRDDSVALGRLKSSDLVRGMSGAPVRRLSDDVVVGVVSARYNSADGWLRDSVSIARTEDLDVLLADLSEVGLSKPPMTAAADLTLTIDVRQVRLHGAGIDILAEHAGVRPGLLNAVEDVRRARARVGGHRTDIVTGRTFGDGLIAPLMSMRRAGKLLADSFLPDLLKNELGDVLRRAQEAAMPVRLGIDISGKAGGLGWSQLPWEAMPDPVSGIPIALHRLITVYRQVSAAPARQVPGALSVVVAISAPVSGEGAVLDYEAELRAVLKAVKGARTGDVRVRIVPFATTAAIRQALDAGDVHVLHISAHGDPGFIHLEDEEGTAREVTAEDFVAEAVPLGKMPPVIALAACYSDTPTTPGFQRTGNVPETRLGDGEASEVEEGSAGPSFAGSLLRSGAAVVIGTETSVTDRYATQVLARVYSELAQAAEPDLVQAVTRARRLVQGDLAVSANPADKVLSGLDEWATLTVLAASAAAPLIHQRITTQLVPVSPVIRRIAGLVARDPGDFVGRRDEQRTLPSVLLGGDAAGVVLHGIGGVGKTTLAAETIRRTLERDPNWLVATVTGPSTADGVLAAVASVLRPVLMRGQVPPDVLQTLTMTTRLDLPWAHRLTMLREAFLDQIPVLLVLDNFEDNLTTPNGFGDAEATPGGRTVRDEALAGLLAGWVLEPGRSRVLVTCRYPFHLPDAAHENLSFRRVGPLTFAETLKLVWSLPHLGELEDEQVERVWRAIGGHPRTLEYVDALLAKGHGRFADITRRLEQQVTARLTVLGEDPGAWLRSERILDAAIADAVTIAADDVLLTRLLQEVSVVAGARAVLLGTAIYREPVDLNAIAFQIGIEDNAAAWASDHDAAEQQILAGLSDALVLRVDENGVRSPAENVQPRVVVTPPPAWPSTFDLDAILEILTSTGLVMVAGGHTEEGNLSASDAPFRVFVHRWTAEEVIRASEAAAAGDPATDERHVVRAHRRAAEYWVWRFNNRKLDAEHDIHDLLEARHHLLRAGYLDGANLLTELICGKLYRLGGWDQAASLMHDALAWLPPDHPRLGAHAFGLALIAMDRGDSSGAETLLRQALAKSEELGDEVSVAKAWNNLGILAKKRGDFDAADQWYRRSLDVFVRHGERADTARALHQQGNLAQSRGNIDEAEDLYLRSIDIKNELGDVGGTGVSYHQLGMLEQDRGNYEQAERHYTYALTIAESGGNQHRAASTYHQLGILARMRGHYEDAKEFYIASLDIQDALGDISGSAGLHGQLGDLAQASGDLDEAEWQFHLALDAFKSLRDPVGTGRSYCSLGGLAYQRRDDLAARDFLLKALRICEEVGDSDGVLHGCGLLAELERECGNYEKAGQYLEQVLHVCEREGMQAGAASTQNQMGTLAHTRGDSMAAERFFRQALEKFITLGHPYGAAESNFRLGVLAHERGSLHEAETLHEESRRVSEEIGQLDFMCNNYNRLGILAQERRAYAQADKFFRQAASVAQHMKDDVAVAECLHRLGLLALERGNRQEAGQYLMRALEISFDLGDEESVAKNYTGLGALSVVQGQFAEGVRWHLLALSIPLFHGMPMDLHALADLHRRLGHAAFAAIAAQDVPEDQFADVMALIEEAAADE